MAAARQKEINASMAVVATRTLATGRTLPGVKMWPVESDDIRYRDEEKNYTLNLSQKQRVARPGFLPRRAITLRGRPQSPNLPFTKAFLPTPAQTRARRPRQGRFRANVRSCKCPSRGCPKIQSGLRNSLPLLRSWQSRAA